MERKELYLKAKENLEEYANKRGITKERLESVYYKPKDYNEIRKDLSEKGIEIQSTNGKTDYPVIFYLFCGHFADRQYMGNIVKFYTKEDTKNKRASKTELFLNEILYNYSPTKIILNKESCDDFVKESLKKVDYKDVNEDKWKEYFNGIYSMAKFLNSSSIENTLSPVDSIDSLKIKLYETRKIQNQIKGVGPAVCYNWLKECGATWLAKPDLHIKRVVAELIFNENKDSLEEPNENDLSKRADIILQKYLDLEKNKKLRSFPANMGIKANCKLSVDEFVTVYMWEWAKEIGVSAYQLDRIMYLYCTGGDFFMDRDKMISEVNLLEMINK